MKNKGFYWGVAALICATTLFSCKNDNEQLGLNNGNNPNVTIIDTFSVFTRTVSEDSFATSTLSQYILGAINSTTYGNSTSDVVLNFTLPSTSSFSFPAGTAVDSVFLVLAYGGGTNYSGNLATPLVVNAFELDEKISADSQYYSSHKFSVSPASIGTYNGPFKIDDSVEVTFNGTTTKTAPHLRLKLDNATFGNKLVNGAAANFATNSAFQDFIKGIKVAADNSTLPANEGVAAYMNLVTGISGIQVYYNDTQSVLFPVDKDNSAFANIYSHTFAATPIETQITTPGNYDVCYLQSMAGSRVLVEVPGLNNLALEDNYAIVGASIVFSADPASIGPGFAAPTRLLLLNRDSNNSVSLVVDAVNEPDLFDGKYNSNTQQYTFNFPRHLQLTLNELRKNGVNYNRGFYLRVPSDNPITATHLIMDTKKTGTSRGIKFRLHVIKVR